MLFMASPLPAIAGVAWDGLEPIPICRRLILILDDEVQIVAIFVTGLIVPKKCNQQLLLGVCLNRQIANDGTACEVDLFNGHFHVVLRFMGRQITAPPTVKTFRRIARDIFYPLL